MEKTMMEAMLLGVREYGDNFLDYNYATAEEVIYLFNLREIYFFEGKTIRVANGKQVKILIDSKLYDELPQSLHTTLQY